MAAVAGRGSFSRPGSHQAQAAARIRAAARSLGTRGGGASHDVNPVSKGIVTRSLRSHYAYHRARRSLYVGITAPVTTDDLVTFIPPAGELAFTGHAPQSQSVLELTPPAGALILSGHAPVLDVAITVPAGSLALTGHEPEVRVGANVTIPASSLTLTGHAPTLQETFDNITVPVGSLILSGFTPSIAAPSEITPPAGSLTLTGHAPSLAASAVITVPAGSVSVSGLAPTAVQTFSITPGVGALILTGLVGELSDGVDIFEWESDEGAINVEGADGDTAVFHVTLHEFTSVDGALAIAVEADGSASVGIFQDVSFHVVAVIDEFDIISGAWRAGDGLIINRVIFSIDWNYLTQQFTKHVVYTFNESVRKYGLKPALRVEAKGIQGEIGLLLSRAINVAERFADPPPVLEVTIPYLNHNFEVGDRISVTSRWMPNIVTGRRGIVNEIFEIISIQMMFAPQGVVRLSLLDLEAVTVPGSPTFFSPEDEADLVIDRSVQPTENEIRATSGSIILHQRTVANFPTGTGPEHLG